MTKLIVIHYAAFLNWNFTTRMNVQSIQFKNVMRNDERNIINHKKRHKKAISWKEKGMRRAALRFIVIAIVFFPFVNPSYDTTWYHSFV